jgi:hypothetical protein
MAQFLRWIRRACRFLFALFLWLHALFILNAAPSLVPYASRLKSNAAELGVLLLLATLTILESYGIGNVIVDAIYIYFFPFVFLFHCVLLLFRGIKRGYEAVWGQDEPLNVSLKQFVVAPQPALVQAPPTTQAAVTEIPESNAQTEKQSLFSIVLRPFRRFLLLWCLLLLVASHRGLLLIALIVVLFQLCRLLIQVFALAVVSSNWLGELEQRIKNYADGLISKLLLAKEITQDFQNVFLSITALEIGVSVLRSRRRVIQWTMYLGTLFFLGIYMYLALIFSFAYYGVARALNIPYDWTTSVVNSMFMPLTFGSLPSSNWIRALGGVHSLTVLALSIGTVFGYIRQKLDSLNDVANELSERLEQAEVRVKVAQMREKFQPASAPSSAAPQPSK